MVELSNRNVNQPVGGIAQLVERLHGMQEVSGSIPLTSTSQFSQMLKIASVFDPIV